MAFDILELPHIPRERDKLKAIIGTARYQRRRSRMIRYISYGILALGVVILLLNACSRSVPLPHEALYLPLILR